MYAHHGSDLANQTACRGRGRLEDEITLGGGAEIEPKYISIILNKLIPRRTQTHPLTTYCSFLLMLMISFPASTASFGLFCIPQNSSLPPSNVPAPPRLCASVSSSTPMLSCK